MSTRTTDVLAGAFAGFLGAATGTAGPPLVLALSRRGLSQAQLRVTLAWVFIAQCLVVEGRQLDGVALVD
jgi:uncharacterized membrane protein YfcA